MKTQDIIIVGGGIVGLLAALAIVQATDLSVVLLDENSPPPPFQGGAYSNRVSAITLGSQQFLSSLGAWPFIVNARVSPFHQIEIEDGDTTALQFSAEEIGKDTLGFIIENELIAAALYTCLNSYERFKFVGGIALQQLTHNKDCVLLTTKDGFQYKARLVIGADGKHSWVRQHGNILIKRYDYQVSAIVATIRTEKKHQKIARQYFLKTGPFAFLPLDNEHYCSIVWSLPTDWSAHYLSIDASNFQQLLKNYSSHQLGDIELVGSRIALPLLKQQALSYSSERIVLVGDAAHVVHPLAGQGVNLGIQDVMLLQQVILSALDNKRDYSCKITLRKYERAAKSEAYAMLKAIDVVQHVFVEKNAQYALIRRAVLNMLKIGEFAKRSIIRFATK